MKGHIPNIIFLTKSGDITGYKYNKNDMIVQNMYSLLNFFIRRCR